MPSASLPSASLPSAFLTASLSDGAPAAKAKSEPKAKNKAEAKDTDAKTEAKKDKKSDFKFDKAMKPIEEGEAGYQKTVAPAKKAVSESMLIC